MKSVMLLVILVMTVLVASLGMARHQGPLYGTVMITGKYHVMVVERFMGAYALRSGDVLVSMSGGKKEGLVVLRRK